MKDYCYAFSTETPLEQVVELIKDCQNEIYFESDEGDHVALKSTLGQFFFFSLVRQPDYMPKGAYLRCFGEEDAAVLSTLLAPYHP